MSECRSATVDGAIGLGDSALMPIRKQDFYEGAALHAVARSGKVNRIEYSAPFFILNERMAVLLKYCTKVRTPWGFTFTAQEQELLQHRANHISVVLGLICGSDGVVALRYESYRSIAAPRRSAVHIACFRGHGEHYEASGPDGALAD